ANGTHRSSDGRNGQRLASDPFSGPMVTRAGCLDPGGGMGHLTGTVALEAKRLQCVPKAAVDEFETGELSWRKHARPTTGGRQHAHQSRDGVGMSTRDF